jgi:anti-sigma factor RsiW
MNDLPDDMQIKSLLKQHADYFDTPQGLRSSILRQIQPPPSEKGSSMFSWLSLSWLANPLPRFAASFGMGIIAATLVTGQWVAEQQKQAVFLALASDHARAVVTQSTMEVRSTSMHTVKPWLSSQLGYSPQVMDLADQGFPLLGGRRGFIGGTPVAVAVYAYRQHEIDVYALTAAVYQQFPAKLESVNGFNTVSWKSGDLHYIAISDVNAQQLQNLCNLLEKRPASE